MALPSSEQLANRRAWLAALRSGSYRQGQRTLRRRDEFCCLGVAEDVVDCVWNVWEPWDSYKATHVVRVPGENEWVDQALSSLSTTAAQRLGLLANNPYVVVRRGPTVPWDVTTLVDLNDDVTRRYGFDQIADVIEDQGEEWDGSYDQAVRLRAFRLDNTRE